MSPSIYKVSSRLAGPNLNPFREFLKKWGALLILSNPPAITILLSPKNILLAPNVTAFVPEAQTLLTLKQGILCDNPDNKDTCLAGFYPNPVDITLPRMISSGVTGYFYRRSFNGKLASWGAVRGARDDRNEPTGDLFPPTKNALFIY